MYGFWNGVWRVHGFLDALAWTLTALTVDSHLLCLQGELICKIAEDITIAQVSNQGACRPKAGTKREKARAVADTML